MIDWKEWGLTLFLEDKVKFRRLIFSFFELLRFCIFLSLTVAKWLNARALDSQSRRHGCKSIYIYIYIYMLYILHFTYNIYTMYMLCLGQCHYKDIFFGVWRKNKVLSFNFHVIHCKWVFILVSAFAFVWSSSLWNAICGFWFGRNSPSYAFFM